MPIASRLTPEEGIKETVGRYPRRVGTMATSPKQTAASNGFNAAESDEDDNDAISVTSSAEHEIQGDSSEEYREHEDHDGQDQDVKEEEGEEAAAKSDDGKSYIPSSDDDSSDDGMSEGSAGGDDRINDDTHTASLLDDGDIRDSVMVTALLEQWRGEGLTGVQRQERRYALWWTDSGFRAWVQNITDA